MRSFDIPLLASPEAFRQAFEQGLDRLLAAGGLNLFILVAANASYDATVFAALRERLRASYGQLWEGLREAFVTGSTVEEADDDLLVFMKIACIGFDALALTEHRSAGPWEVQFNQLRSFRPMRNSQRPMDSIRAPFDAHGFHFNKPFMQQEVLWSGELLGRHFDLYYNKYPFVDLHCLLVPERERCLPQFLCRDLHEAVWQLVQGLAPDLPGIRIAYNALGAYASVNHLHFQLCVRARPLPVEAGHWRHNGGAGAYPVDARRFASGDAAWDYVQALHERNEAYNLLYSPAGIYCMPRLRQGSFALADWSSGFSWYEMCGGVITFNCRDFEALQDERISEDLARAASNVSVGGHNVTS